MRRMWGENDVNDVNDVNTILMDKILRKTK